MSEEPLYTTFSVSGLGYRSQLWSSEASDAWGGGIGVRGEGCLGR